MSEEKTLPESIKFKYKHSDSYNPVYANGAHGGISTQNEIILNFYLERHPIPESQTHELNQEGVLGKEIERKPSDNNSTMLRFIENGVILNLESAIKIRDFLDKHIKIVESIQKQ